MEILISDDLYKAAVKASKLNNRTIQHQIEYWARLGIKVENCLSEQEIEIVLKQHKDKVLIVKRGRSE